MIRIIPAIDIIDGKCVRLTEGKYESKKVYDDNPVSVAKRFEDAGIKHLHLVDLDGAKQKKVINWKVLKNISQKTSLKIDFGGGIQSDEGLTIAFENGAQQITAGSIAVREKELVKGWIENFGNERIIIGADSKDKKIAISGWQDKTSIDIFSFLQQYSELNMKYTICTDIAKDGRLSGTNIALYKELKKSFPDLFIIASGGITSMDEIIQLEEIGLEGCIIGKALYEGKIKLNELKRFLC